MNTEEQYAACLLYVGTCPKVTVMDMHTKKSEVLKQSRVYRRKCYEFYKLCVMKRPDYLMSDMVWQDWMSNFLSWCEEQEKDNDT